MKIETAASGVIWQRQVKLPRSAESRQDLTFALLIRRVFSQRTMGDAFEGKQFRPGATINESDLWPEPGYSESPLLLEYAGSDRSGHGHRRSRQRYFLWSYDPVAPGWAEIARAAAVGIEWVEILKPVALRYLTAANPANVTVATDAVSRVLCLLESELEPLEAEARRDLLTLLWEQVQGKMVVNR